MSNVSHRLSAVSAFCKMAANNDNENRPNLWQSRRSSSCLSLFSIGPARPFLPFNHANSALQQFAANMSKAERRVFLSAAQSEEIPSPSFEFSLFIMPDRAYLELFRFNRRSLEKFIRLLSWPAIKQCTELNGYQTTSRLATSIVIARLAASACWCDLQCLFQDVCSTTIGELLGDPASFHNCTGRSI